MEEPKRALAARFGRNMARCRKDRRVSQDELSRRALLHRTEVSQLERGLRLPRIDTVAKVAGALDIEPGELFEGIKWTPGRITPGEFDDPAE